MSADTDADDSIDLAPGADAAEAALAIARDAREEVTELRDQLEAEREARRDLEAALRDELDEVRSRTDMLRIVENGGALDQDQRLAVILQTLADDAGEDGRAETTAREAWNTLHRGPDRTTLYDDLREAVERANDELGRDQDVVRFEERPGQEPSVLVVDRSNGHLPATWRNGGGA